MYYENFEKLCDLNGVRPGTVSKATGISTATLTCWKQGKYTPKQDKLQLIANYFSVSLEYLMTGEEISETKETTLTPKDERDIAKDVDRIMEKLSLGENGPASYNGEILSEESMELFKEELQIALKRLKLINKERYNPHKNKE